MKYYKIGVVLALVLSALPAQTSSCICHRPGYEMCNSMAMDQVECEGPTGHVGCGHGQAGYCYWSDPSY